MPRSFRECFTDANLLILIEPSLSDIWHSADPAISKSTTFLALIVLDTQITTLVSVTLGAQTVIVPEITLVDITRRPP